MNTKNKRALILEIATEKEVLSCACSPSGFNFCKNLALSGIFDSVFSLVPWQVQEKVIPEKNLDIQYIQSRKKILEKNKIFNFLLDGILLIRKVKSYSSVWFYNLSLHTLIPYIIIRFFLRKKVFVILADFDKKGVFISKEWILEKCITHADGIISLSSRSIFLSHKNFCVLPGFVPQDLLEKNYAAIEKHEVSASHMFLYAGAISKPWGAILLVDTFAKLPNLHLSISGPISLEGIDREAFFNKISSVNNISYEGLLPTEEYRTLLKKSTVLFSLRDPDFWGNQNNFPSKLIEALLWGKEVVSTMKYPELTLDDGCDISLISYSERDLAKIISYLYERRGDADFWQSRRKKNFEWLMSHVSKKSWLDKIQEIEKC